MITAENAILRVKRIRQSRNGAFSIADLTTEFGEFKVKDPLLEQFEEGEYEATVWISEIFLGTYVAYGKAVTEIRARLHDLQVHTEDHRPAPREPIEPDPIDEQEPIRLPKQPDPDQTTQPASDAAAGDRRWDQFKKPRKAKGDSKEMPEAAPVVDSPYDAETLAAVFAPALLHETGTFQCIGIVHVLLKEVAGESGEGQTLVEERLVYAQAVIEVTASFAL